MLIETRRLLIRDVGEEDGPLFAAMAADGSLRDIGFDPDCGRWMPEWIEEAKELARQDRPDRKYLAYTVILRSANTVIGSVGCSYYEDIQETGITYFLGAQYRNNGFAAEAVRAYVKYFFDHYPVSRIIATVREDNTPSWRTVEKAGFRLTEKKMYQDLDDDQPQLYRFYERTR